MSSAVPAPHSDAFAGILACPCCQVTFSAALPAQFPRSYACGHVTCAECASAAELLDPPQCPVCHLPAASDNVPDVALATFADATLAAESGESGGVELVGCEDCATLSPDDVNEATHACSTCGGRKVCEAHGRAHEARKVPHEVCALRVSSACGVHRDAVAVGVCVSHGMYVCTVCASGCSDGGHEVVAFEGCGAAALAALRGCVRTEGEACMAGCASAMTAAGNLQRARERLIERTGASCGALKRWGEGAKSAVDRHVAQVLAEVDKELQRRLKGIDSQLEELGVSANQLACVGRLCASAACEQDARGVAGCFVSAKRASRLLTPYHGAGVSTVLEVVVSDEEFVSGLSRSTRVRGGVRWCEWSGDGSKVLCAGEANVMDVSVRDDAGVVVDSLSVDDVHAWIESVVEKEKEEKGSDGSDGSVPVVRREDGEGVGRTVGGAGSASGEAALARVTGVSRVDSGVFRVVYEAGEGVRAVEVGCRIGGSSAVPGPRAFLRVTCRWSRSCKGLGVHVRTITHKCPTSYGMAVSSDERWLVTVSHGTPAMLFVFDLSTGSLVRTIGGAVGKSEDIPHVASVDMRNPFKLCFTPAGTLLVGDRSNNQLKELTLEGELVRSIAINDAKTVCCNDTHIIVGNGRYQGAAIEVFEFATGKLVASFGSTGSHGELHTACEGIRFTPDGQHVLATSYGSADLVVFTLDGTVVKRISGTGDTAMRSGHRDVEFLENGDIVVAEYMGDEVVVVRQDGGRVVRRWGVKGTGTGEFSRPSALAVVGKHLYVLESDPWRVQVFE